MANGINGRKTPSNSFDQTGEPSGGVPSDVPEIVSEIAPFSHSLVGSVALEGAFENLKQTIAPTEAMKAVIEQLTTSYLGYEATLNALNLKRYTRQMIQVGRPDEFASDLESWLTSERLGYADIALEEDRKLSFTLVATPNLTANPHSLKDAVKAFNPNDQNKPYVDHILYDIYSGRQLSGTNPTNGRVVQFSLMPSKDTNYMRGTIVSQRAQIERLQKYSNPNLRVPSVLEAFTYWQTLDVQGKLLKPDTETYIRHFNLVEQAIDGLLFVPDSYISKDGSPRISGSNVREEADARLSIG